MKSKSSNYFTRVSIGKKLLLTYFSLALLAIFSTLVGWFGFSFVDNFYSEVVEVSTPSIAGAYRLSESVNTLIGFTSDFQKVEDVDHLERLMERVDTSVQKTEDGIAFIQSDPAIAVQVLGVDVILSNIYDNAIEQRNAVQRRILAKKESQELRRDAVEAAESIIISLRPVIAEVQLRESGKRDSHLEALEFIERNSSNSINILNEIPFTESTERLSTLKTEYTLHLRAILGKLREVTDPDLRKQLAARCSVLLAQLNSNSEGVFSSTLQGIQSLKDLENNANENDLLSQEMTAKMLSVVSTAQTRVETDYAMAKSIRGRVLVALLLFIALFILIPLVLVFAYIRPRIVKRIEEIASVTQSLAKGDLDVTFDTSGEDELAMMATALEQFKSDLKLKLEVEEALRESEERFELAVSGSSSGLWDRNLVRGELYWSPRFLEILGISDQGFVPRVDEFERRVHPDERSRIVEALESHLKDREPYDVECRLRDQDGSYIWVHARGQAVWNEKGDALRFAGSVDDVNRRKEAEERVLLQKEELEESNRELEQYAFVASHDLKEPLRTISSFIQLLELEYGDKFDETGKEYLGFVVSGASRLKTLISDLLIYSRLGKVNIKKELIDFNTIVSETLQSLGATIKETGAAVEVETFPEMTINKTQMIQLMQNLIGNALKFRKENIPPRIQISHKYIICEEGKKWHRISVEDNGIGIETDYKDTIFVIFQRLNDRRKYDGTGIGLSICKKTVERHGGKIWMESEFGVGTKFYFTLPC